MPTTYFTHIQKIQHKKTLGLLGLFFTGTKIVLHFLLQLASKIQWSQNLFKKIHLPMQILKDKLDIMQVIYKDKIVTYHR